MYQKDTFAHRTEAPCCEKAQAAITKKKRKQRVIVKKKESEREKVQATVKRSM